MKVNDHYMHSLKKIRLEKISPMRRQKGTLDSIDIWLVDLLFKASWTRTFRLKHRNLSFPFSLGAYMLQIWLSSSSKCNHKNHKIPNGLTWIQWLKTLPVWKVNNSLNQFFGQDLKKSVFEVSLVIIKNVMLLIFTSFIMVWVSIS